mmetsp:Transcript_9984/g.21059  ORF Transcript_9984/g.21059 Transcript_9984/m.21059 type:complete len:256 (+) Transcript_9984:198-965(+)
MNAPAPQHDIVSFLWELKTELDASRKQVNALKEELGAQRNEFLMYRKDNDDRLSELRKHKNAMAREVVALQMKFDNNDDEKSGATTTSSAATKESDVAAINIKTETPDDENIKSSLPIDIEEKGATTRMEPVMSGQTNADETATNPTMRKSKLIRKISSRPDNFKDRVMQQRIALLRHASRCNAPIGTCKVSRHCAKTKAVWNHIVNDGCNDPKCSVKHCVSSRYVLSRHQRQRGGSQWSLLSHGAICEAVEGSL